MLVNLASPWNWIYQAEILAKDIRWYEKNVMGTGPFKFVEHVKGSHWVGKKNPRLLGQGQAVPRRLPRALRAGLVVRAGRGRPRRARPHPVPRLQPAERDTLVERSRPQDHGPGEPVGLRRSGGDEPREEALRRQARPPGAEPRAGPVRGIEGAVEDRRGQGRGRRAGAGHAVRHAARRAGEARRLRARHQANRGRGPAVCCARPASPTASRSPSRTAASRCPTSRWASGSSTSGARSGST